MSNCVYTEQMVATLLSWWQLNLLQTVYRTNVASNDGWMGKEYKGCIYGQRNTIQSWMEMLSFGEIS